MSGKIKRTAISTKVSLADACCFVTNRLFHYCRQSTRRKYFFAQCLEDLALTLPNFEERNDPRQYNITTSIGINILTFLNHSFSALSFHPVVQRVPERLDDACVTKHTCCCLCPVFKMVRVPLLGHVVGNVHSAGNIQRNIEAATRQRSPTSFITLIPQTSTVSSVTRFDLGSIPFNQNSWNHPHFNQFMSDCFQSSRNRRG